MSGPTQAQWLWRIGRDTGVSSETIWHTMTGAPAAGFHSSSPPLDPADFGRCHRLLALFPEWRSRLAEVAEAHCGWGPMVREWSEMERLYVRDLPTDRCDELYALMRKLLGEAAR